jgi:hypothetical protein
MKDRKTWGWGGIFVGEQTETESKAEINRGLDVGRPWTMSHSIGSF